MYKSATTHYPQGEVHSALIPVTTGCSHNKCVFCNMYKEQEYSEVSLAEIENELKNAPDFTERIFLTGADPLNVGFTKMMQILKLIQEYIPYCACVSAYASIRGISKYTVEQLTQMRQAGLRFLYVGFESGWDEVLQRIGKGHTVEQAVEQAQKLNEAKISFKAVIIYGVAGKGKSVENAIRTAKMLNRFHPDYIVTMNLTVFTGTKLAAMVESGEFEEADLEEKRLEVATLLEHLEMEKKTVFDTTHVTNIVKLKGVLPEDKEELLTKSKLTTA